MGSGFLQFAASFCDKEGRFLLPRRATPLFVPSLMTGGGRRLCRFDAFEVRIELDN